MQDKSKSLTYAAKANAAIRIDLFDNNGMFFDVA